MSHDSVITVYKRHPLALAPLTVEQQDMIRDLYTKGFGAGTIARLAKLPSTTQVERFLKEAGLMRSKIRAYEVVGETWKAKATE